MNPMPVNTIYKASNEPYVRMDEDNPTLNTTPTIPLMDLTSMTIKKTLSIT